MITKPLLLNRDFKSLKINSKSENLRTSLFSSKSLLKLLKSRLGCGGTIKDEWIEIQGDKKEKIIEVLESNGWKFRKK